MVGVRDNVGLNGFAWVLMLGYILCSERSLDDVIGSYDGEISGRISKFVGNYRKEVLRRIMFCVSTEKYITGISFQPTCNV